MEEGDQEDSLLLERRFRQTLENVAMAAVAVDLDGRLVFANDHLLRLTGWTRDEAVGEDWFSRFVPEPETMRAAFHEAMSAGELPTHYEGEIVTRSGGRRTIFWSSMLLRDDDDRPEGVVSLGTDVTSEREAQEVLRSREDLFRSLIENATDVIALIAADGTTLYKSPSVERVVGWKPAELVGMPAFALFHEADLARGEEAFAAILAGEEPDPLEVRLRHRDGSWRTVEAVGRLRVHDGEPVVVVNYRDVTDQRSLQEQLLHAQKLEAVGRLAGGIAHDFNNLLTAISGYGDFLASSLGPDDPRREDALEIIRASDRASALTAQLLTFSRRQVAETEVLDVGEVVVGVGRLLSRLLGEDVTLLTRIESGCLVRADRGQIEQVLTNLAVNARDAITDGGTVEIGVRCSDDSVELLVADTGSGIDGDALPHIFEPFFTTKGPGRGTGLGLATVYGIVTQAGGEVAVSSEPGAGTTFRIALPRVPGEEGEAGGPEPVVGERVGSGTILVAEDEETIRRLVTQVLSRSGFTVHSAATGDEALDTLKRHRGAVDLLLTDVVMPGMSGPDLARAAVAVDPGLRVLYTSGYASEPDEAFEDPDVDFIGKPFSPQALVEKIREVLGAESGSR
jgi:two-component system, cell cycle sensor histidine kinase and response regulator CckA